MLLLTTFDADEYVFEGLRAGASGFLLKDTPPEQLCWAVRTIAGGNALIDPVVTHRLILRFAAAARTTGETPRAARRTDAAGARRPAVDRPRPFQRRDRERPGGRGVDRQDHVGRILMKLGLRDRVQAVVLAYECGLMTPDLLGH